jgi:hypothetical protein
MCIRDSFKTRLQSHKRRALTQNTLVYRTIRENGGWDAWTMSILEQYPCANIEEAQRRELHWIAAIGNLNTVKEYDICDQSRPRLTCPRCGYVTVHQKSYMLHLLRDVQCLPLVADVDIRPCDDRVHLLEKKVGMLEQKLIEARVAGKNDSAADIFPEFSADAINRPPTTPNKRIHPFILRNKSKLDWKRLSANPSAAALLLDSPKKIHWPSASKNSALIGLLLENQDKICWSSLCANESNEAMRLLEQNLGLVDWDILSGNPAAAGLLSANKGRVNWAIASGNAGAATLLLANQDKIDWHAFSANTAPLAIAYLEQNLDKASAFMLSKNPEAGRLLSKIEVCWQTLSSNSCTEAIALLEPCINKINWLGLSKNSSPTAVGWLRAELVRGDKRRVNWFAVSQNTGRDALDLLAENPDKVEWSALSANTGILID